MTVRLQYRLLQTYIDHRWPGRTWDTGVYAGEVVEEAPRDPPRVRLFARDDETLAIEVLGTHVRRVL